MRVFFLTNRRWGSNPGKPSKDFLASRHAMASGALFGFADAKPSAQPDDPDNDWDVPVSGIRQVQVLTSGTDAIPSLSDALDEAKEVLVFIHGFSNDFQNAIRRAARLARRYYKTPPMVIAITWPSAGDFIGVPLPLAPYRGDQASAWKSGPQLAMALTAMVRALGRPLDGPATVGAPRINLVAHSMGNRALRSLAPRLGTISQRPFERIMMMAADEDPAELAPNQDFANVLAMARNVDVYTAGDDDALLNSQKIDVPFPGLVRARLGLHLPLEAITAAPNLTSVNCRFVSNTDHLGVSHFRHQYYRARPEVIEDVRLMLKNGSSGQRRQDPAYPLGRGFEIMEALV